MKFAQKAEEMSTKQLALACSFNEPNSICRCKLFLSFSYIQLRKFKQAKRILRKEYAFLSSPDGKRLTTDDRLFVMCIAGLKKLRFEKNRKLGEK